MPLQYIPSPSTEKLVVRISEMKEGIKAIEGKIGFARLVGPENTREEWSYYTELLPKRLREDLAELDACEQELRHRLSSVT